jgi:hypothetical protein
MGLSPRLLRPTASGFNPKSISGLIGWWDFSDASTLGPSSSGIGTVSNNGPIKYVADKSGASAAMIQTGADSVAPTYLTSGQNNLSVAGFDGGDRMTNSFTATLTAETVFVVARMTSLSASNARLFTQSDSGNDFATTGGYYVPLQRDVSNQAICGYTDGANRASVGVLYDNWFVACALHTGSQIENRVNNGSAATFSHTLNKQFTRFGIGDSLPSGFGVTWRDRIGEVLLFSRALSSSEMNAVARWLGKKWNITVA